MSTISNLFNIEKNILLKRALSRYAWDRMSGDKRSKFVMEWIYEQNSINLDNYNLNSLNEFPYLPKLRMLFLQNNNLLSLDGLPSNMSLDGLYLSNNRIIQIYSLKKDMRMLSNLQVLDLSKNNLSCTALKMFPPMMFNLKKIDLSGNNITKLYSFPLAPLVNEIKLDYSNLTYINYDALSKNVKKIITKNIVNIGAN